MRAIIEHLRFPFSVLLLPVFLFALSEHNFLHAANWQIILLFIILHVLIYPSSNAYNSLQDKDEGSIGLIKNPLKVPKILHFITIGMDVLAIVLSLFFKNYSITILLISYIAFSRLYSYRKIRLKQYPIIGFLTVFIFQGFVIFCTSNLLFTSKINFAMAAASSCLIGSMYPLSQIYQHKQDANDGVKTLSMLLGYNGTFIFSAILFLIGTMLISFYYFSASRIAAINTYLLCGVPVIIYFFYWFYKVSQQTSNANFKNTMLMNLVSCICLNTAFLLIYFLKY